MRERVEIAKDIVSLNGDVNKLREEISLYPWDLKEPIVHIINSDVLSVLKKAISGQISFVELEDWANEIECRDDFSFENENLQEVIIQLANPLLYGGMSRQMVDELIKELRQRK
ncbi:MAG: hypothetical protein JSU01_08415 [Bacteroidetes bacterium]|nr:hypothetical protein [Bacteroidota bacterium]